MSNNQGVRATADEPMIQNPSESASPGMLENDRQLLNPNPMPFRFWKRQRVLPFRIYPGQIPPRSDAPEPINVLSSPEEVALPGERSPAGQLSEEGAVADSHEEPPADACATPSKGTSSAPPQ